MSHDEYCPLIEMILIGAGAVYFLAWLLTPAVLLLEWICS